MTHRTTSCPGLKTEVPEGVAQQYVAQHPPIMSDHEHSREGTMKARGRAPNGGSARAAVQPIGNCLQQSCRTGLM